MEHCRGCKHLFPAIVEYDEQYYRFYCNKMLRKVHSPILDMDFIKIRHCSSMWADGPCQYYEEGKHIWEDDLKWEIKEDENGNLL